MKKILIVLTCLLLPSALTASDEFGEISFELNEEESAAHAQFTADVAAQAASEYPMAPQFDGNFYYQQPDSMQPSIQQLEQQAPHFGAGAPTSQQFGAAPYYQQPLYFMQPMPQQQHAPQYVPQYVAQGGSFVAPPYAPHTPAMAPQQFGGAPYYPPYFLQPTQQFDAQTPQVQPHQRPHALLQTAAASTLPQPSAVPVAMAASALGGAGSGGSTVSKKRGAKKRATKIPAVAPASAKAGDTAAPMDLSTDHPAAQIILAPPHNLGAGSNECSLPELPASTQLELTDEQSTEINRIVTQFDKEEGQPLQPNLSSTTQTLSFECGQCSTNVTRYEPIEQHFLTFHPRAPIPKYRSICCGKIFLTLDRTRGHKRQHCKICNEYVVNSKKMRAHMLTKHPIPAIIPMQQASASVARHDQGAGSGSAISSNMSFYLTEKRRESKISCPEFLGVQTKAALKQCDGYSYEGQNLLNQYGLLNHLSKKFSEPFRCPTCNHKFLSLKHALKHDSSKCIPIPQSKQHNQITQNFENKYLSDLTKKILAECTTLSYDGKNFDHRDQLIDYVAMILHHETLQCPQCKDQFNSWNAFKKHEPDYCNGVRQSAGAGAGSGSSHPALNNEDDDEDDNDQPMASAAAAIISLKRSRIASTPTADTSAERPAKLRRLDKKSDAASAATEAQPQEEE